MPAHGVSSKSSSSHKHISGAHPKTSSETLYTTRIKGDKTISRIKDVISSWKKLAEKRLEKAKELGLSKEKIAIAVDSKKVIDHLSTDDTVFVTYDSKNKVQAIATAKLSKKSDTIIECLATNPYNIPLFGTEKRVSGAPRAAIRHIAADTVRTGKKRGKKLGMEFEITHSSKKFYKKIGFKIKETQTAKGSLTTTEAEVDKKNMIKFLKRNEGSAVMKKDASEKFW